MTFIAEGSSERARHERERNGGGGVRRSSWGWGLADSIDPGAAGVGDACGSKQVWCQVAACMRGRGRERAD
jgi:hypothetical protein